MTISPLRLAVPPRFGTERNPANPTLGPAVGQVARLLGFSLMPWQQHVADVVLEIDPKTGRLVYTELRLTVPRQSGKTILVLSKAVHRCRASQFFTGRQNVVYTAQTRKDARKKFKEDYEPPLLHAKGLKGRPSWSPGDEHVRFPTGSRFGIESTTEKAGHGGTVDEVFIDEAFAQIDNRLEQAFDPAMITRKNTMMNVISTAGWLDASPFLWSKVEHGRQLIESGEPTKVATFEWSAPQDADPYDRDVWRKCMPALGYTIDEEAIAERLVKAEGSPEGLNGFRRAYLNQWVSKFATTALFPGESWQDCADPTSSVDGKPVFAVAVTPDRTVASLAACGRRADGLLHGQIVEHGPVGTWFTDKVVEIVRRQNAELVLNPAHAAGALLSTFQKAKVRLHLQNSTEYTQGCGALFDDVKARQFRYPPPQPELDAAVRRASRKLAGETYKWAGDQISALVAVTQAAQVARKAAVGGSGRVVLLK